MALDGGRKLYYIRTFLKTEITLIIVLLGARNNTDWSGMHSVHNIA